MYEIAKDYLFFEVCFGSNRSPHQRFIFQITGIIISTAIETIITIIIIF